MPLNGPGCGGLCRSQPDPRGRRLCYSSCVLHTAVTRLIFSRMRHYGCRACGIETPHSCSLWLEWVRKAGGVSTRQLTRMFWPGVQWRYTISFPWRLSEQRAGRNDTRRLWHGSRGEGESEGGGTTPERRQHSRKEKEANVGWRNRQSL